MNSQEFLSKIQENIFPLKAGVSLACCNEQTLLLISWQGTTKYVLKFPSISAYVLTTCSLPSVNTDTSLSSEITIPTTKQTKDKLTWEDTAKVNNYVIITHHILFKAKPFPNYRFLVMSNEMYTNNSLVVSSVWTDVTSSFPISSKFFGGRCAFFSLQMEIQMFPIVE